MNDKGILLVVDDFLDNLKLLTSILTAEGYQVHPANSGELALASVEAGPPDLILLDMQMPGLDGFEVCRRLKAREESRAIPIIFISAATEVKDRVEGLKLGAVDFIAKPFQREELMARVHTHLELSRLRKGLEQQAIDLQRANEQLQREIVERKRMEEVILEMSLRDELTKLYNRRGFLTMAEQQLKAANRSKAQMLLAFIDLDGMKGINDTLGHDEGDRALIDTANILQQTFRESDIIARMGGDEFTVLAIDMTDLNPEILSKRLQQTIDDWTVKESRPYKLTLSWGAAIYDPESPLSLDKLISAADELMYAQKRAKLSKNN
jgi:diguanylate cyclase (GGDEF)-like protein